MKVPDKFPPGCRFAERVEGGFFVEFPGGDWFALAADGASLSPRPGLGPRGPISEWYERSEADFFKEAEELRLEAAS